MPVTVTPTTIISKPDSASVHSSFLGANLASGFFETIGKRNSQEDALAIHQLDEKFDALSPEQARQRMWTALKVIDQGVREQQIEDGTTVSTTLSDKKGNFITATLGDAVSFAVFYDQQGKPLGVKRLNEITHKPGDETEQNRIKEAGGFVAKVFGEYRVGGRLAVARALGDHEFTGVCADARIDINNVQDLAGELKLDVKQIASIQVITTCDGFTDGAGANKQSKEEHEAYLLKCLQHLDEPGFQSPDKLSRKLALQATKDGSGDNISVAIANVGENAFALGVFDGHGGSEASSYAAENFSKVLDEVFALSEEEYARHPHGVAQNPEIYARDNKTPSVTHNDEKQVSLQDKSTLFDLKVARGLKDLEEDIAKLSVTQDLPLLGQLFAMRKDEQEENLRINLEKLRDEGLDNAAKVIKYQNYMYEKVPKGYNTNIGLMDNLHQRFTDRAAEVLAVAQNLSPDAEAQRVGADLAVLMQQNISPLEKLKQCEKYLDETAPNSNRKNGDIFKEEYRAIKELQDLKAKVTADNRILEKTKREEIIQIAQQAAQLLEGSATTQDKINAYKDFLAQSSSTVGQGLTNGELINREVEKNKKLNWAVDELLEMTNSYINALKSNHKDASHLAPLQGILYDHNRSPEAKVRAFFSPENEKNFALIKEDTSLAGRKVLFGLAVVGIILTGVLPGLLLTATFHAFGYKLTDLLTDPPGPTQTYKEKLSGVKTALEPYLNEGDIRPDANKEEQELPQLNNK
ncbi:PP2C family serine/threonine-protein phosphatase [Legionella septentrionalis]|uniref:PPM-type phosphatase domain-containing protein n=1 Tax=Legionella septentrionalis TaxID=2498109 RepID=A0A3S0X1E9_9GAMM|nr:hypothetical protein [Legionella septentrionalis]RUQ89995.1 hypothetical protein EKM59_02285 [Legionella septentrionalis]RUQ97828.1 hypothetical protein ELY11_06160 [Legionella septentrionalis]